MRIVLVSASDVAEARGDTVHLAMLHRYLRQRAEVTVMHRGLYALLSGRIASGEELHGIRNAFKLIVYHLALSFWIMRNVDSDTVIYCRDWSVAFVAGFHRVVCRFALV